ncbi:MAG: hypothetical protein PHU51_05130 [Candidatus Nanoarchaeia archaeon]|nr:hypothetical protein [Candidatus Nanoarchaeia archaeon]
MTNMTLAIPQELHTIIKQHSEIRWSEIARKALWEQARKLEIMDEILSKSKLTESDAKEISNLIKKQVSKRHKNNEVGNRYK